MEISISAAEISPDDLIRELESLPEWRPEEVRLLLRKRDEVFRSLDPTVVVAVISAASTGFGALLSGLLGLAKESKNKTVVLQDKDGRRLELPSDYPKEKIEELLEVLREMEGPTIKIS